MRTGNPTLNDKTFENFGVYRRELAADQAPADVMTINGTAQKTLVLLLLAMSTAYFTWSRTFAGAEADSAAGMPWAFGGLIVGLITGLVICFKHTWAPALAPVYALAQGLFLGGISATFEAQYPGIVLQAVGGTFGTLFGLLLAYQSGLIKANPPAAGETPESGLIRGREWTTWHDALRKPVIRPAIRSDRISALARSCNS